MSSFRLRLLASGALALSLAFVATALASSQFTASVQFSYLSQKPHASSGLHTVISWSDPGEPFGKPKAVKRFRFQFPAGARLDTRALPACKASDSKMLRLGPRACPPATKLGSGSTQAIAGPGIAFQTVVTLFNARKQIIVLVQVNGRILTEFRDTVERRTLTVNTAIPAGISLTHLDITIPAHSRTIPAHSRKRGRGRGKRFSYFRTPSTCPAAGSWTTAVTFDYVDGSSQTLTSATPCAPSTRSAARR